MEPQPIIILLKVKLNSKLMFINAGDNVKRDV